MESSPLEPKDGAAVEEDGSVSGGPGCMPIGCGRSGGRVRLRPVSGMRGEGGVLLRGAGTSGALVVLEAAGCGRRAKVCLARFILRHSVAAASAAAVMGTLMYGAGHVCPLGHY